MGYKFSKNSLKDMARIMKLETQKGDIDYKIFFQDEYTDQERKDILKYLRADVEVTKQMFDKLWNYWYPFTEFLDDKNILNLSWIRSSIASLRYKCDCKTIGEKETYADSSDKTKEEMGGRVVDPKHEEARQVWYADFTSLYPHMYAQFNLYAEENIATLQEWEYNIMIDNGALWHGNDMFKVKGYYDISEHHPLSLDTMQKLKWRVDLKENDPDNPMIGSLKIFLNAGYGAQRSPIFEKIHTPNGGWDCCWLGQQINEYTENRMYDFGFDMIAGDTDSGFFIAADERLNNPFYVRYALKTIVAEIKANVPFPVDTFDIALEYPTALPYIMWAFKDTPIKGEDGKNLKNEKNRLIYERKGKKKNYVYLYEKNGETKLKIMGLPIIKDNATKLGKRILDDVLKTLILTKKSAKFTKEYLKIVVEMYLDEKENLKLLAREWKVKPTDTYAKPESQIQAQISTGYFNGQDGVIDLIKLKVTGDPSKKGYRKIGSAGKGSQYATIEECEAAGVKMEELDLEKLWNELEAFVRFEGK